MLNIQQNLQTNHHSIHATSERHTCEGFDNHSGARRIVRLVRCQIEFGSCYMGHISADVWHIHTHAT